MRLGPNREMVEIFISDQMTRLEFETELLKDEKLEREEEVIVLNNCQI